MSNEYTLNIVTGAPGSGKSTTAEACAHSAFDFVALDMDWLIDSASALANVDIHFASETWGAYNQLWLDVAYSILRNGLHVVLFAPLAPDDLKELPPWCTDVRWLLLDCPNNMLRQRLVQRQWSEPRIQAAIKDASELRTATTDRVVHTNFLKPAEIAASIVQWVEV